MNKLIVAIVTAVTLASTSLAFAETRYRSPCDPYAGIGCLNAFGNYVNGKVSAKID